MLQTLFKGRHSYESCLGLVIGPPMFPLAYVFCRRSGVRRQRWVFHHLRQSLQEWLAPDSIEVVAGIYERFNSISSTDDLQLLNLCLKGPSIQIVHDDLEVTGFAQPGE